jgi:hypothetical protein
VVFSQYVAHHTASMLSLHPGHGSVGDRPEVGIGAPRAGHESDDPVLAVRLVLSMVVQGSRNRDLSLIEEQARLTNN